MAQPQVHKSEAVTKRGKKAPNASVKSQTTKKSKNGHEAESRLKELEDLVAILSRGKYMWESTFDAITDPVSIISKDYTI